MRLSDFSEAIVQQANCREVVRVPMMSGRIVRLEIDGSPEFPVAAQPVPIDEGLDPAERCVSLGQVVVEVKSHASRLSGLWECLCRRQASVGAKNQVGIGDTRVSLSIIWVLTHGLKKVFESCLLALSGPLPPAIAALEVKVMGSRIDHTRFSGSRRIVRRQFGADLAGYRPSHIIFQSEDVAQVALEALSPQMPFLIGVNQLRGDPYSLPRPEYRAFNDRVRAELARNFRNRLPGTFIARSRAAGDHPNLGNLTQIGGQFICHSGGEVFLRRVAREIVEGQDCERFDVTLVRLLQKPADPNQARQRGNRSDDVDPDASAPSRRTNRQSEAWRFAEHRSNRSDEPVTTPRNRFNEPRVGRGVAQRITRLVDRGRQSLLVIDEGARWPEFLLSSLAGQNLPGPLQQQREHPEWLGLQLESDPVPA